MKTLTAQSAVQQQQEEVTGPPSDVEASELVTMLTTLPRPHKIVGYPRKLPGSEQPISHLAIVAAYIQDKINAQAAAHAYTRQILADPNKAKADGKTQFSPEEVSTLGYEGIFRNAVAIELLFRACKTVKRKPGLKDSTDIGPGDYEMVQPMSPAFPGARWMRTTCTDDEIGVLTAAYLRAQMEIGPIVAMLSDAESDLWIEKLIAGGIAGDPFDSLASDAKTDLVMRSVFHLRNYRMGNFSFGVPLGSGSTASESLNDLEPKSDASDVTPPPVELDEAPIVEPLPVEAQEQSDTTKPKS